MRIYERALKIEYESQRFEDIKVGEYFEYNNELYIKTRRICCPDHEGNFATKLSTGIMYDLDPYTKVIPVNLEIFYNKYDGKEIQFSEYEVDKYDSNGLRC